MSYINVISWETIAIKFMYVNLIKKSCKNLYKFLGRYLFKFLRKSMYISLYKKLYKILFNTLKRILKRTTPKENDNTHTIQLSNTKIYIFRILVFIMAMIMAQSIIWIFIKCVRTLRREGWNYQEIMQRIVMKIFRIA